MKIKCLRIPYTGLDAQWWVMSDEVNKAVAALWDYMQLKQPVKAADVIVALGSRDDRVATHAAALLQDVVAQCCVVSGGSVHQNDLLKTAQAEATESDHLWLR